MLSYKQAMYDNYVLSGSSSVCFTYGMNGHCGPECPDFGMRDGCEEIARQYWAEEERAENETE